MLNTSPTHSFDFEEHKPHKSPQASPQDANLNPLMDATMPESMSDDDLDKVLGFLDINDFCQL